MTGSCTKLVPAVKQDVSKCKNKDGIGGVGDQSVQLKVQSSHWWVTSAVCDGDVLVIVAQAEGVSE